MKIAITGHRPNKLGNDFDLTSNFVWKIKDQLQSIITKYNDIGRKNWTPLTLITGMALGIDTLFAQLAILNKIPFITAIPCINHGDKWHVKLRNIYDEILSNSLCTKHYVTNKEYTLSCMQKRNEWMVDNCDVLIAVWDSTKGGTANCVKYARSVGKPILWLKIDLNNNKIEKSILLKNEHLEFNQENFDNTSLNVREELW